MHLAAAIAPTRPASRLRLAMPAVVRRDADFFKLWAGQTVSLFGSEVTMLALPLTAALALGASPFQVGLIAALERLPNLLVGLFAGVWVDRLRRRPILIAADLGRAALLGSIPLAAVFGVLRLEHLYVVSFLTGLLTLFFAVAYQSYLPSLVRPNQLIASNARLETTRSAAEVAGVTLGAVLIQVITAPLAIVIDALSYIVSSMCVYRIRTAEAPPKMAAGQRSVWRDIRLGLSVTFGHELLRPLATCSAAMNLCYQALFAVYVLYATRTLGLEPTALGLIMAAGSAAGVLGSVFAARLGKQLGIGRSVICGALCSGLGGLLIPMAQGPQPLVVGVLIAGQTLLVLGLPIYNVNAVSLRQTLVPAELLGRVTASSRFVIWGSMPIGAALGGVLGEMLGLRPTMFVATAALLLATSIVICSPVRRLRELVAQ